MYNNKTTNRNRMATTRRDLLTKGGKTFLSASAIAALGGTAVSIAGVHADDHASQDVAILNVALGLEHEGIAAYQLGAESGLLSKGVLEVAVQFQSHHKAHRDALVGTIRKMGGAPVAAHSLSKYATDLNAADLRNQTDVLKLATKLELGAANAYLGVIPSFENSELAQVAARLAADETMHWTMLTSALGEQLPKGALTFGG